MDQYADDQIGDLEGDDGVNPLTEAEGAEAAYGDEEEGDLDYGDLSDGDEMSEMKSQKMMNQASTMSKLELKQELDKHIINDAANNFIQEKKIWGPLRNMHKEHAEEIKNTAFEQGKNFMPNTAMYVGKDSVPMMEGELDEDGEEYNRILKKITLENEQKFEEEAEARGSDYESPESEEDPRDKWDAETILSTYTNTDNHPNVIKFQKKVKVSNLMKIDLHKQFKVPVDGLEGLIPIAEEVELKRKQKKKNNKNAFEEDSESDEEAEAKENGSGSDNEIEETDINPRKANKKLMKAERREKRKQKKELKLAFKDQMGKISKQKTADQGELRPGISLKPLN